uniref:Uncharacterized protein n=1 Tax=Glossina austeni TaxID=7395 RepID=A0A1A9UED2_GLOAU
MLLHVCPERFCTADMIRYKIPPGPASFFNLNAPAAKRNCCLDNEIIFTFDGRLENSLSTTALACIANECADDRSSLLLPELIITWEENFRTCIKERSSSTDMQMEARNQTSKNQINSKWKQLICMKTCMSLYRIAHENKKVAGERIYGQILPGMVAEQCYSATTTSTTIATCSRYEYVGSEAIA